MKCTDISSRLVDFLYEEIAPAERAEFNAHLASCPTCATEVKTSSRALQRTRTALAGPLNEEPPARVHATILAAARAAAQPARKPRVEQKEGFFTRLWKAPWLIPAMGAAGVATAVFLIKVIKNPEVLPVREPASPPAVVGKPQPTEEQALSPVLAPAEPQSESKSLGAKDKDEERPVARAKRERAGAAPARSAPAAAQGTIHRKMRISDDPLDGIGAGGYGVAPSPPKMPEPQVERAAPAAKRAAPATKSVSGSWAEPPPPREPSGGKKRGAAFDDLDVGEGASGAAASQPRGQLQQARPQESMQAYRPAPAAAAPPPAPAAAPMPSAAPLRPAAARDQSFAKAKRSAAAEEMAEEAESMADSAPPSNAPAAESARADKKGGAAKETFNERVRKADKLYREEKWYEALVAYRALLDEAPNHPSAPTWRQRFLLAEKAHKASSPVRAKSKISDDALDGM